MEELVVTGAKLNTDELRAMRKESRDPESEAEKDHIFAMDVTNQGDDESEMGTLFRRLSVDKSCKINAMVHIVTAGA